MSAPHPADYVSCHRCGKIVHKDDDPPEPHKMQLPTGGIADCCEYSPAGDTVSYTYVWREINPNDYLWKRFVKDATSKHAICPSCGGLATVVNGVIVGHNRDRRPGDGRGKKPVPCEGTGQPATAPTALPVALPPAPKVVEPEPGPPILALLSTEQIRTDGGTQQRVALDLGVVADYADKIRDGATFPPLVVFEELAADGDTYWLADGFHRLAAAREAGKEKVQVEIRTGTRRDALLYSVGANASHGLRRSNADKRRAVETLLADPEWATWSDRRIAEATGTTHPFVGKVRRELAGEEPPEPVESVTTPTVSAAPAPRAPWAPLDWPTDAKGRLEWITGCADLGLINQALRLPGVQGQVVSALEAARRELEKIERSTLAALVGDLRFLLGWSWPKEPAPAGKLTALLRRVEVAADQDGPVVDVETIRATVASKVEALDILRRRGLSDAARVELLGIARVAHDHLAPDGYPHRYEEGIKMDPPPALRAALEAALAEAKERQRAAATAGVTPSVWQLAARLAEHPERIAEATNTEVLQRVWVGHDDLREQVAARLAELGVMAQRCPDLSCVQGHPGLEQCPRCHRSPGEAAKHWTSVLAAARETLRLAGESDLKTSVLDIVDRIRGGFLVDLEEVAMELQVAAGVEGLTDDGDEGDLDDEGGDEGDDLTDDGDDA